MRRNRIRRFFQQKQYAIASFVLFAAIAAMTGVYFSNRITNERQEEEIAKKEAELSAQNEQENLALDAYGKNGQNQPDDTKEDVASVNSVIKPKDTTADDQKQTNVSDEDQKQSNQQTTNSAEAENSQKSGSESGTGKSNESSIGENTDQQSTDDEKSEQKEEKLDTAAQAKAASSLHFSPDSDLSWPLQGDVILNYSMDQTVYFATLEQYKYNPALIIAGKVNDPVKAAATGKITDISANEETGVTVTMDLGNGYSAIYGQLKEVLYKEGAMVEAGNAIGYIAEPTKYYSVEGSNLYFELQKDHEPVNPMQYIQ